MKWVGYLSEGKRRFGAVVEDRIEEYEGDLFADPVATGRFIDLSAVKPAIPFKPSKFIGLWNNSRSLAVSQSLEIPTEPLFFVKPANCYAAHDDEIALPIEGVGRIVYEAELGVVIGKRCKDVSLEDAPSAIFGYTCVNDLTALSLMQAEAGFMHWSRAKGLDGFGPFGPVIETALDLHGLSICTRVNGRERQRYTSDDLILKPHEIVSLISRGMTLEPGDIIACGTSGGVGPVPKNGAVEVEIDGIGVLRTHFRTKEAAEAA